MAPICPLRWSTPTLRSPPTVLRTRSAQAGAAAPARTTSPHVQVSSVGSAVALLPTFRSSWAAWLQTGHIPLPSLRSWWSCPATSRLSSNHTTGFWEKRRERVMGCVRTPPLGPLLWDPSSRTCCCIRIFLALCFDLQIPSSTSLWGRGGGWGEEEGFF